MKRQRPPGRMSISRVSFRNPLGENHWVICWGSVQAWNTLSRGASTTRAITISRSSAQVERVSFARASVFWVMAGAFRFVRLSCVVKKVLEAVETRLPGAAGEVQPGHRLG